MDSTASAEELTKQGMAAFKNHEKAQAARLFFQATQVDPSYQRAWLWLGSCLPAPQDKRVCFERAVALDPESDAGRRAAAALEQLTSGVPWPMPPAASPVASADSFGRFDALPPSIQPPHATISPQQMPFPPMPTNHSVHVSAGTAVRFALSSERGSVRRMILGALLLLIPVLGQLWVLGYMIDVARHVAAGQGHPLPPISFTRQLGSGVGLMVIAFAHNLPVFILLCFPYAIPLLTAMLTDDPSINEGAVIVALCFLPIIFLVGIVMQLLLLASIVRYVQTERVGAALRLSQSWGLLRALPGTWILVFCLTILAGIIAGLSAMGFVLLAGFLAFFSGLFGLLIAYLFFGHVLGQVASQS